MSDGLPVFGWGEWPPHLMTKKQLDDAGYQTGKLLPSPAAKVYRSKSPGGVMWLYDVAQAVPKKVLSDDQKAKIKAARDAAALCPRCNQRSRVYTKYFPRYSKGRQRGYWNEHRWWAYCEVCEAELATMRRRQEVAQEMAEILAQNPVILDTETSALDGEIIEIAAIDADGTVLLNQRLNPKRPEEIIASGAYRVHGIHPDSLALCPTFHDVYWQLSDLLANRLVVIYNADFDRPRLWDDCQRWGLPTLWVDNWYCAMLAYARWVGEWSNYHGDYRWQPLPGARHGALEDCRATLELMRSIVESGSNNG